MKNSWSVRDSCNFDPTFILTGNLILGNMSGLRSCSGRQKDQRGYPPGLALGVKIAGNGTLGTYERKRRLRLQTPFFFREGVL